MPSYLLLIAFMASPIVGILVSFILSNPYSLSRSARLQSWVWLPIAVGAAVALVSVWLLGSLSFEAVIGNWSPISFTGVPLTLGAAPAPLLMLAAWVTVYFAQVLSAPEGETFDQHLTASALLIPALALVALASNFITLLVGLGIVDMLSTYLALQQKSGERQSLSELIPNSLSTVCLLIAVSVPFVAGDSLSLPFAQIPDSLMPLVAIALVLRFRLFPIRRSLISLTHPKNLASVTAGLIVLTRLPTFSISPLPPWFFALTAFSAFVTLLSSTLEGDDRMKETGDSITSICAGSLFLAVGTAAVADPLVTAAAAAAWVLGCLILALAQPARTNIAMLVARTVGGACWLGVPATVGFIGQSGVMAASAKLVGFGTLTLLARVAAFMLLGYRLACDISRAHVDNQSSSASSAHLQRRRLVGLGITALTIVVMGLTLDLSGAASHTGALGWLILVLSLIGAAVLWHFRAVGQHIPERLRLTVIRILNFDWLGDLLVGAIGRLRAPLPHIFSILESDGTLVWAMIIVLLFILVARPGTP